MYIPKTATIGYNEIQEAMCEKAQEEDKCIDTSGELDCIDCICDIENLETFTSWYRNRRSREEGATLLGSLGVI